MENDILTALTRVCETIVENVNRPLNLNLILETAAFAIGAPRSLVFVASGESDKIRLAAVTGFSPAGFRRLESLSDLTIWKQVIDGNEPVVTVEIRNDPDLRQLELEADSQLAIARINIGRKVLGLIGFELDSEGRRIDVVLSSIRILAAVIAQNFRVEHAVMGEREKLREENLHLKQELKEKYEFSHLVGNSGAMRQVYEQISQVARSNATVLLRGESGTGKEMIANAIHYNSLRSKRPLIKINCAALPDTLIESELFGHEKGAFTGADRFKKGRFEMADGGTLFLDEIGDLPLQTQIKLLRVLQEREFERLGGSETIKTNIRLITATNKNLEEAIAAGEFREDLYYRLNVFSIFLPPLRERKSDILLLAEHFLEKYEAEYNKRIRRIATSAIDMLMSYHFPGNVRELENAIERAVIVCDTNVIHGHHLPPSLQTAEVSGTETRLTLTSAVAAFERDLIQDALKSSSGNVAGAARQLESTERILGYKIKKYGIDTMRFRK